MDTTTLQPKQYVIDICEKYNVNLEHVKRLVSLIELSNFGSFHHDYNLVSALSEIMAQIIKDNE